PPSSHTPLPYTTLFRSGGERPRSGESSSSLDSAQLPAPALEQHDAHERQRRVGHGDGEEHALGPEPPHPGEDIGERNLPQPEAADRKSTRLNSSHGSIS